METENMTLNYWTGMFRCGGGEVGGTVEIPVTEEEKRRLETYRSCHAREFTELLATRDPGLLERIHGLAAKALERQMAEDAWGNFDFSGEEFEGWTYEQQLQYVMDQADPDVSVDDICSLVYEIPK